MSTTSIEWATHVWNPFTGCDRVSPGCAHCYAAEVAASNQRKEVGRLAKAEREGKSLPLLRYQNDGDPKSSGPGFKFTVHQDRLDQPPKFPPGARVFVNSMSDVFHDDAEIVDIARVFAAAALQPHTSFLILTKRAERMHQLLSAPAFDAFIGNALAAHGYKACLDGLSPLPNVWLGVSIENRRFVYRADLLRQTPAAVRFISAEPLLGPLVGNVLTDEQWERALEAIPIDAGLPHLGENRADYETRTKREWAGNLDLTDIDWLIVGAESGGERRRFDVQWARDLRDACLAGRAVAGHSAAGNQDGQRRSETLYEPDGPNRKAFFFKQGSAFRPGQHRELDGRTWDELPQAASREAAAV